MIPIMNGPSAPYADLFRYAQTRNARTWYFKALTVLWQEGLDSGVDPVVLAAQCAHETGWGAFTGAITADFGNTCGLKHLKASGDRPEDHARFAIAHGGYPVVGARAHAHHLRLYCGFPVPWDTPDPRAVYVMPGTLAFGSVSYVEELSGAWAPAADYGMKVSSIVIKFQTVGEP